MASMKQSSILQGVAPKGSVLQVVSTTKTDTYSESVAGETISTTIVTGLTAAITPVATSSKIRVEVFTFIANSDNFADGGFVLRRGSTAIGVADTAGSRPSLSAGGTTVGNNQVDIMPLSVSFVDSPSSTSELTYGISVYNRDNSTATVYLNRAHLDGDDAGRNRTISTITLTEVAG